MPEQFKVAISADFFSAFSALPKAQQSKVSKFITNFQKNPRSPGIHYEKINAAVDSAMRSVRIDQAYRGIVLQPEKGNVYMLLWVAQHDAAYDWSSRHRCAINAQTGAIQVFEVEEGSIAPTVQARDDSHIPGAFVELKDKELMRLGVPEPLLPLVRQVKGEKDLEDSENRLPQEAFEGLFMYLAGYRYDEIINEREFQEIKVDTSDFDVALERLTTRSKFVIVDDEIELQAMLNAPLEKWRVFLHPSQRRLAQGERSGPVRVLGGAGTGKTVVAIHRAKWLAENFADDQHKVLFTTFTKNLATDIEKNLSSICSAQALARIEVINLDRLVSQFLRKRKYDYSIIFGNEGKKYWELALSLKPVELGFPDAFYFEEWQKVVQPHSIETLEQYRRVSRVGRGTRLGRADRVKVWPVFEEYRTLLTRSKKKEVDDAYRDVAALLEREKKGGGYCSVVVDEAQDMSTQAFKLIRRLVKEGPNDLFIVGDGHQRIYGRNKVVLSQCGINIRGRSKKLRVNYRTTEEIRCSAVGLLEDCPVDDLDGKTDDNKGYRSLTHGNPPEVRRFASLEEQCQFVTEYLTKKQETASDNVCIVARTKAHLEPLGSVLEKAGLIVRQIKADQADDGDVGVVRLATMHRVKGLEFDEVLLTSINKGVVPWPMNVEDKGDSVEARMADMEERALLYVAMTRARKRVMVLGYGELSEYLK